MSSLAVLAEKKFIAIFKKKYTMGFLKEFRQFMIQGNVIELAIAVIIGAAFGAIVSSMVDDVITPLLLTPALKSIGASNIAELKWGEVKYGNFLAASIKFIVIAFVLFLLVKGMNSFKKKEKAAPEVLSSTDKLLIEIRDALSKR